ncbi:MAG: exo-alpha-sialidase [Chloroflexi bacterium]|nr:exo-alpha-sialidase [Chloroflexota bacterium]
MHGQSFRLLIGLFLLLSCQTLIAGQHDEPFYRGELIFKPTLRFPRCHSSTIISLPDGSLMAAWWNGSEEGGKDNVIRGARRPAGAHYWEPPEILADTPDTTEGNPVLFNAPAGELWLLYRAGLPWVKMMWTKSQDAGKTWNKPEAFLNEPGWSFRSRILSLANGDIIIPVMTHGIEEFSSFGSSTAFLYSADKGKTWGRTKPIITSPRNNEPTIVQRSDGSLLAFMRPYDRELTDRFLWKSKSTDNGRTWTEATKTQIRTPSKAIELLKLQNGHVVLVFNDTQQSLSQLSLALSEDDGRSWKFKRVLEDSPGRFTYPTLAQSPDGNIHISYTFRRTSIKHVEVNEAWIRENPWSINQED